MYITILCILSFLSLITSLLEIYGVIISTILLIISIITYSKLSKIHYKHKTILIIIIVCIISFINSCIFTSVSHFVNKKLNIVSSINYIQKVKILQEYSALNNIIKYYAIKKQVKGQKLDIFMDKVKDIPDTIYNTNKYPPELLEIIAIKNSKSDYYYINFDKLNANFYITNKDIWIIDKFGKLYLNSVAF